MPNIIAVQGFSSLTQQARLVLEANSSQALPGEQLLAASQNVAATLSLTTQPDSLAATTGMQLHFYIQGNTASGTIVITGTKVGGGAQTSATYHVAAAPQNNQGYTEFTTSEVWETVGSGGIAITTIANGTVTVYGSIAGKYLIPLDLESEEKIAKFSPQDKRGLLFKNFRVTQLTKGVEISSLKQALYGGISSLLWPYLLIGNTPVIANSNNTTLLASTSVAATMTLTTAPKAPGMFFVFAVTGNTASGTIVLNGTDNYGNAVTETITATSAATQTLYSQHRYSALTSPGTNEFTTTGLTSASIAVTGTFGFVYTWTYDGITNPNPYSGCWEFFDGAMGVKLPYFILQSGNIDFQKEKELAFDGKGMAQDFLIVGDPNPSTYPSGTNPFATLSQPTDLPMVSWPATFYLDTLPGTPFTTQIGEFLTFKFGFDNQQEFFYSGDGAQRPQAITRKGQPDFTFDATVVFQSYQEAVSYFKPNQKLAAGVQFQGAWLGTTTGNVQVFENWQLTLPVKIDSYKRDATKNPIEVAIKQMSEYDFVSLGYAFKLAITAAVAPTLPN